MVKMSKDPEAFLWNVAKELPRLSTIFRVMKECNSELLYVQELEDEVEYIRLVAGAQSRKEAIDFIARNSYVNNDPMYSVPELQKSVKLWDDDLIRGYESKEGKSFLDLRYSDQSE